MNWLITLLTAFQLFCASNAIVKFLGAFHARIESVQDYDDIPRDKIDWKMYIKKSGKNSQTLCGSMLIKQKLGPSPLALTLHIEKYTENAGYKNFMMNGASIANVCTDKIYKRVMANYNGTMTPDCTFPPEYKYLRPLDIDDEIHRYTDSSVYGKFRVGMRFHVDKIDVMGFQVIIIFEDSSQINSFAQKKRNRSG